MREKVVGTTFRTHPDVASFAGTIDNTGEIPVFTGRAILMPEPTNEYDTNAIAVVAEIKDGKTHHLGYCAKNGEFYTTVTNPTLVTLRIYGYSTIGLSDSFQIEK